MELFLWGLAVGGVVGAGGGIYRKSGWVASAPHSGQRSGVARRSYPQARQRTSPRLLGARSKRRKWTAGSTDAAAAIDQHGVTTPRNRYSARGPVEPDGGFSSYQRNPSGPDAIVIGANCSTDQPLIGAG